MKKVTYSHIVILEMIKNTLFSCLVSHLGAKKVTLQNFPKLFYRRACGDPEVLPRQ